MNNSVHLPIFESEALLNPIDITNVVVFPILGLILFSNKSISIYVTLKVIKKNKNYGNMFYYLLSNEFCDLMIALILPLLAIFKCGILCDINYNYYLKIFEIIVCVYLLNVFIILKLFLELAFAIERLKAFNIKSNETIRFRSKLIIIISVAVISSLPNYLISRTIKPTEISINGNTSETFYTITNYNIVDTNQYINAFLTILLMIRGPILYMVFFIINTIVLYKFKMRLNEKKKLQIQIRRNSSPSEQDESKRYKIYKNRITNRKLRGTRLLLTLSLNYLLGNVMSSIQSLVFLSLDSRSLVFLIYSIVATCLSVFSHSMNVVIYYHSSPIFRKCFLQSLKLT